MTKSRIGALLGAVASLISVLTAGCGAAQAADKLGIVLMHGLQGEPNAGPVKGFAASLDGAGYLLAQPEMCWSRTRVFDKSYLDCLAVVDIAIAKLRGQGATMIVIAGMSMGGNAALGYGGMHDGLKGVIALAPAPDPVQIERNPTIAAGIQKAKDLIDAGKGDAAIDFDSVNGGHPITVHCTPKVFLSFYGDDSPARLPVNVARFKAPLLWVAGTSDPSQKSGPDFAFAKAPPNPLNRYVTVDSDHLGTPDAAKGAALAWLKDLLATK